MSAASVGQFRIKGSTMTFLENILEQPDCLRRVTNFYKENPLWAEVHQLWQQAGDRLILTGLGASFHALYPMHYYLQQQGIAALHLDTGELIHYASELLQSGGLLVVVSQSGESIEILKLLEKLPSGRPLKILSLTTQSGNTLAQHSDIALHTQAGAEVGVATKTFTSTLAVLHWLGRSLTVELTPEHYIELFQAAEQMEHCLSQWESWILPAFTQLQEVMHLALVARGPMLAAAHNGALVLQEAVRLPAAPFAGSQFRHGPMEMLSEAMGTIVYTSPGRTETITARMVRDISDRGGTLVTVGSKIPDVNAIHLDLPIRDEWLSPIVSPIAVQLLAAKLAEARGLVPGQFRWSGKVIREE
jgi:glutamine---fructose-6-phosphate transaminase (isomerizing)